MSATETAADVRTHAQQLRTELNDLYSALQEPGVRDAVPGILRQIRGVDAGLETYLQDHRDVLEHEPDWSDYYALDRRIAERADAPDLDDLAR